MAREFLTRLICSLAVWCFASAASGAVIYLDGTAQGDGNKGTAFRPSDGAGGFANFLMTARSMIDNTQPFVADAPGSVGTICIDKGNGAGVQAPGPSGSEGISGAGKHQDEELIFTYDHPVHLSSIFLGLANIDFGKGAGDGDDPVIFLSIAGSGGFGVTVSESQIKAAFTAAGSGRGTVDFSRLTSLPVDTAIDAFKVRETYGHISVVLVSMGVAVPEPAAASLLAIGAAVSLIRRGRRRAVSAGKPPAGALAAGVS
jgi:hypothetical protein